MKINILLLVLLLLALWRAWRGCRAGLVGEVSRLVSLVAALFVLSLVVVIISSFRAGDTKNGIIAVILLLITGILLHLVTFVMKALKAIAELPLINLVNAALGLAAGIAEVMLGAWLMYYIINIFPTGELGVKIMEWTNENQLLQKLYEWNPVINGLSRLRL